MVRGRLLYPFLAQLCCLERGTGATPTQPMFDPDFKEPILVDRDGDGVGERERAELPPVLVPCQVEPGTFEQMRISPSGRTPRSSLDLVFHFRDLERLELVDAATGLSLIQAGDRLGGIYDQDERLVQLVRNPPGLFVTETRPAGFGLGLRRPSRNLLMVSFSDRAVGAPGEA